MNQAKLDALTAALRVQTVEDATRETMATLGALCMPKLTEDYAASLARAIALAESTVNENKQLRAHLELALETITALLHHVNLDLFGQVQVSRQYGELRQMAQRVVTLLAPVCPTSEGDSHE